MGGARKGAGAPKGKPQRKATAPPDPDITREKVESLAALGMNGPEIAGYFGLSKSTISRKYSRIIEKGRERLKVTLRQSQIKIALSGNVAMLIWLGKQLLGQSDKIDQKTAISGEIKTESEKRTAEEVKAFAAMVAKAEAEENRPADEV